MDMEWLLANQALKSSGLLTGFVS